jgi:hypothetical protein
MTIVIELRTDDAAFEDHPAGWSGESADILARLAREMSQGMTSYGESIPLFDANGNRCGVARIGRPETEDAAA